MKKCDICKRGIGNNQTQWILEHFDYKNIWCCDECNLSISEQIWIIIKEWKK